MRKAILLFVLLAVGTAGWWTYRHHYAPPAAPRVAGTVLDSLHGVLVYDNGSMGNVSGRRIVDGYNVGLKYQCVEFVKRYYLEHYDHRMPNSYGHAKDLFDTAVADGALNTARALRQFTNPSRTPPAVGDLLVLDGWHGNPYGHVAIISAVDNGRIEVVQQNTDRPRDTYRLTERDGQWRIASDRVLGRLRK